MLRLCCLFARPPGLSDFTFHLAGNQRQEGSEHHHHTANPYPSDERINEDFHNRFPGVLILSCQNDVNVFRKRRPDGDVADRLLL